MVPPSGDLAVLNDAARAWCDEVNAVRHSEIWAIPNDKLEHGGPLLRELPMLRPRIGRCEVRNVDRLSTISVASAR